MENDKTNVPFIVHESIMARMERTIKRLWILCIIMFVSLVLTNGLWICYESSFEDVVTSQEVSQDVDTGNGDAVITGIEDINYGENKTESQD